MRALAYSVVTILVLTSTPARAKWSCGKGGATGETKGSAGAGTYIINVPSSYTPARGMPLLIALHGDEGKPDYIHWSFRGLQQTTGGAFILVSPRAPFGGGSWYKSTSKHRDFIDAVIQKVLSSYNIDQDRIWITGWSGGGLVHRRLRRQAPGHPRQRDLLHGRRDQQLQLRAAGGKLQDPGSHRHRYL